MLQHIHLNMRNILILVFRTKSLYCVISPSLCLISTTAGLINEAGVSEKDDNITSVSGVYELLCITILRGRRNHGHYVTLFVAIHSLKSHVTLGALSLSLQSCNNA